MNNSSTPAMVSDTYRYVYQSQMNEPDGRSLPLVPALLLVVSVALPSPGPNSSDNIDERPRDPHAINLKRSTNLTINKRYNHSVFCDNL